MMKRLMFILTLLFLAIPVMAQQQVPISGGVATIDVTSGNYFKLILNQNVTSLSFTPIPAPPKQITILFTQDATGGRTVAFATGITSTCSVSSTANSSSICQFVYDSSSATWNSLGGSLSLPTTLSAAGPSYAFSISGGIITANPGIQGGSTFTGTDAAVVINNVLATMVNTGGTLYFKNGTYNLSSATQETVSPYTLFYCIGIPSTNTTSYPQFYFVGESGAFGLNVGVDTPTPNPTGVIFNVTSAAETAAGSGVLAGVWMRPNTVKTQGASGAFWNDQISMNGISIVFPNNQRGNEIGIDMLEASYFQGTDDYVGFAAIPTLAAASGDTGIISPATPSNGIELTNVYAPYWAAAYEINTEHSILKNTYTFEDTTGYEYGWEENRNASVIFHSSQWIHPIIYDCINGIKAGTFLTPLAELDILGLDVEYITTGNWAYNPSGNVPIFATTNAASPSTRDLTGLITWTDTLTNVGAGSLSTIFQRTSGVFYGSHYTTLLQGSFVNSPNAPSIIAVGTSTSSGIRGQGSDDLEGWKDSTPTFAFANGWQVPGGSVGNNYIFSLFNGTSWNQAFAVNPTTLTITPKVYTVSTLPSASTAGAGAMALVSDASTFTVGTCTGGGSDFMLAVSNGTTWSCH